MAPVGTSPGKVLGLTVARGGAMLLLGVERQRAKSPAEAEAAKLKSEPSALRNGK